MALGRRIGRQSRVRLFSPQAITITKRGLPFATLVPARRRKVPLPPIDRLARLRRMFPGGPAKGDVQSVTDYDRENT